MPATNPAQVKVAWNNNCASFSFDAIPDPTPSATVASEYNGSTIERDLKGLYDAMQAELTSTGQPDIDPTDLLGAVLSDSAWYS